MQRIFSPTKLAGFNFLVSLNSQETAKGAGKMGIDIKIPKRNPQMKEVLALTQTKRDGKIQNKIESVQGKRKTRLEEAHLLDQNVLP
jgi:5-hydroxyisourate hydrolase-like protein (transthyretin family)